MDTLIFWGEILRKARIRRHLTQKEVADILHITRQSYSSYETGRIQPTPELIAILSNIYDLNLFDHVLKYLPADYLAEQHEFKSSIPTSPELPAGKDRKIRKKTEKIYPENIDFDD